MGPVGTNSFMNSAAYPTGPRHIKTRKTYATKHREIRKTNKEKTILERVM